MSAQAAALLHQAKRHEDRARRLRRNLEHASVWNPRTVRRIHAAETSAVECRRAAMKAAA